MPTLAMTSYNLPRRILLKLDLSSTEKSSQNDDDGQATFRRSTHARDRNSREMRMQSSIDAANSQCLAKVGQERPQA